MQLEGVRDLSQLLPGPHLSMIMADHVAEVVKVERYIDVSMPDCVVRVRRVGEHNPELLG